MKQTKTENRLVLSVAEIAYYCFFAVMLFAKGIGLYDGMWPYTLSLFLGAVFIIVKLALTEHTLAEWLFIIALTGLGILVWHNSGEKGALIYIAMIVAMKNVPVKRLFYIGAVIWGSTFVIQTILTITGIRQDIVLIHAKLGLGYIIRWSLGQPHPNVLQISFMILCAFILYLADWKGKKLVYATLIMLLANLYVFFYSVSYTGLIVVMIYLFGNLYLSFRKEFTKIEKVLVTLIFPVCVAFSVLGPVTFPEWLWSIFYKLTNTRFYISKLYLTLDPITLFGARPSDAIPVERLNIDCSYVFALMHYGSVIFVLLVAGYLGLIHHCIKEKKHRELAIIISLVIAAVTEPFFVNPSFKNISMLFLGEFLFAGFKKYAEKKPEQFFNRTFILLPIGKKEFSISMEKPEQLRKDLMKIWKDRRKAVLVWAGGVAVAAGIIFAAAVHMPKAYYALQSSADIQEEYEDIYLDMDHLPDDFEGKILNYRDAQTPMYRVEGNIVKMEYIRGIVSSGLWCGLFGGGIATLIFYLKERKRRNRV